MGKKKGASTVGIIVVALMALIAIGYYGSTYLHWGQTGQVLPGQQPQNPNANCGSTNLAAVSLQFFNGLNNTGAENNDTTIICTGGGIAYTITDTTSPTATNMNCGFDYVCKVVSGIGTTESKLVLIKNGPGSINADGNLVFSANKPAINIDVQGTKYQPVEARLYDNNYAAYTYAGVETVAGGWSVSGAYFGNTTYQTTAGNDSFSIGSGGKLNLKMDVRVKTFQNAQLEDRGWYLFYDMPTNIYSVPAIAVNGVTRTSQCSVLNDEEKKAYGSQEYCYKITGVPTTNNEYATIDMVINALSGVNPLNANGNVTVTIVPIGAYQSTLDTKTVKVGAVKDDSSQTVVLNATTYVIPVN